MKKRLLILTFCLSASFLYARRLNVNISSNWKFGSSFSASVTSQGFDDSGWETVDLPHTWNNLDGQDGDNNYKRGAFWYRKVFQVDANWEDKKVFLRFGSANMKTDVYLNGNLIGTHVGGYGAFIFDITACLNFGQQNTMAVRVDNSGSIDAPPLSADFTFFGGITREVELLVTNKTFISPLDYASSGVYISPYDVSVASAKVNTHILVGNHNASAENVQINTIIKDRNGLVIDSVSSEELVPADSVVEVSEDQQVNHPILWSGVENPYVYHVTVQLMVNGELKDEVVQPLGFRYYHVDVNTGFYLNGKKYALHGVAMHEDRADKGHAVSDADQKQDMEIVHELGCTFLRLAHYQHGQYTYNYCDTSGMILWTEVPVINKVSYSAMFTNSAKTQLRELIKQNYNHPSVFFWGLFNEINFLSGPDPAALIGDLNTIAHQLDSTRLTTAAAMLDDRATHSIPDLIAFNKYIGWYGGNYNDFDSWADNMHKNHLDFKIGLSEYGAGADTADHVENPFPPNTGSFYHPEEYQSNFHERYWKAIKQRPYIWGTALWVGFDFASDGRFEGIAPGINDKGLVTRDRKTKKDAFFFYKANWTTDPFVYISSRRYRERLDSLVEVKVYSNCDSVSIRLNDSLYPILTAVDHIFKWEQGLLKAGKNIIRTVGFKGGGSYRDSCVWYFDPSGMAHQDSIMKGDVQINFQPVSSNPPSGYLVDNGLTYGDRGNGYVYGWNADNSGNMRDRQSTSDTIFNTFDHMQKDGPDKIWEMAVSNGTYRVTIGCGDPDYTDSYHVVEVEGKVFVRGTHPAESMLIGTDTVSVNDGKITVRPSLSSVNAKLNFIHLTCLTCGATSVSNAVAGRLGILVFPNPASDRINIDLSSGFGEVSSVTVFNSNGQILKKLVPISETMPIDTGKWGKGLYLIAVLYNDGKVLTHKVVLK